MSMLKDLLQTQESPNLIIAVSLNDLKAFTKDIVKEATEESIRLMELRGASEFLTIEQVCEALNVDKTTLWRWDNSGYLRKRKVGGRVLYAKQDVIKVSK